MNIGRMAIKKWTRKPLAIFIVLLLFVSGGYGYYSYQNADLTVLGRVASDLPANIPSSKIVRPDYGRIPLRDSDYAVQGHYTIIEYRQENCAECARLDGNLEVFLKLRKDVAVRKIDLSDHWSDKTALRDFRRKIYFTPFIVIYGVDGKQIRADDGSKRRAANLLYDWLKSEFARGQMPAG